MMDGAAKKVDLMAVAEGVAGQPKTSRSNSEKTLNKNLLSMFEQAHVSEQEQPPRQSGKVWTPPKATAYHAPHQQQQVKAVDVPSPQSVTTPPDFYPSITKQETPDSPPSPRLSENPFMRTESAKVLCRDRTSSLPRGCISVLTVDVLPPCPPSLRTA
jgi:hypothetical protein